MGRMPCCVKEGLKRGAWTAMEDEVLRDYINVHGEGKWRNLPSNAGLKRCGKSCRLRWLNYLKPNIKRGNITSEEEDLIISLRNLYGNRWSLIAGKLPGRTDNEIKNYWNTVLAKRVSKSQPNSRVSNRMQSKRKKPKLQQIQQSSDHEQQLTSPTTVQSSVTTPSEAPNTVVVIDGGIATDTAITANDVGSSATESNLADDFMDFEADELLLEFLNMEFVLPYCYGELESDCKNGAGDSSSSPCYREGIFLLPEEIS